MQLTQARFVSAVAVLLVAAMAPTQAAADVVVVVPPQAAPGTAADQQEAALEVLARALRLDGFQVVASGQAVAAAEDARARGQFATDQEPVPCATRQCALAYRALFDAVFAAQLWLFVDDDKPRVQVLIAEQGDATFEGQSTVEGGDIRQAVLEAYRGARARQSEGVGPFLTVEGEPRGARVVVDGLDFGRVPIRRRRVAPGVHRVSVEADGYETDIQTLRIEDRPDFEATQRVSLTHPASLMRPRSHGRHWADWTVGSVALAGGGLFTTLGVRELLRDGNCTAVRDDGSCSRRVRTDLATTLNLGLGLFGVALGATTLIVAPFGYWLEVSGDHASLGVNARF